MSLSTEGSHHSHAPLPDPLLQNHSIFIYRATHIPILLTHSCKVAAPPLPTFACPPRTFAHTSPHQRAYRSAPLYSFTPAFAHFLPKDPPRICAPSSSAPRTFAPSSTKEAKQMHREDRAFSHTNKSFLQCNQIVGSLPSEGMYGGIEEKSIGYPRKVYRVFRKSL